VLRSVTDPLIGERVSGVFEIVEWVTGGDQGVYDRSRR
jgi:hypothetical protein